MSRADAHRRSRALAEEVIGPEDLARREAIPIRENEVADLMDLVAWFRRRYPSARERFAYIRRKHAEWTRRSPTA